MDNNEQNRGAHSRPATLGSVEADPLTPAEANGQNGSGARSGGDPFAEPPLAYQIAQYFRMVYADDQPASGPEGDAYGQAIDDLGEAIWAELQTKEYRALCDENERLRKEHERRDAVWDRVHWKHDDGEHGPRARLRRGAGLGCREPRVRAAVGDGSSHGHRESGITEGRSRAKRTQRLRQQ